MSWRTRIASVLLRYRRNGPRVLWAGRNGWLWQRRGRGPWLDEAQD